MSLTGRLEDVPLVDVLQFIKLSGRNGLLVLDGAGTRAEVGFFRGNVVRAHHPSSEPLGRRLVANGCLSEDDLQRALAEQQRAQPPPPIGVLLLRLGLVRRDEVVLAFRQQMLETIHELLRWRSGGFRFSPDERKPPDDLFLSPSEVAEVTLDTEQVLLEGAHLLDEQAHAASPPTGAEAAEAGAAPADVDPNAPVSLHGDGPTQPARSPGRPVRHVSGTHPTAKLYLWALSRDKTLLGALATVLAPEEIFVTAPPPGQAAFRHATARRRAFLVDVRGGERGMEQLAAVHDAHPGAHVLAVVEQGTRQAPAFAAGATSVVEPDVESIAACLRTVKKRQAQASSHAVFAEGLDAGLAKLRKLIGEVRCGVISATPSLSLLNLVSDTVERGVFFAVDRGDLVCLGGFGRTQSNQQVAERTRGLRMPIKSAGVLGQSVRDLQARSNDGVAADLPGTLMDRIGWPESRCFGVFPVLGANGVFALLYVDNGTRNWPVEEVEFLELAAAQMGLALENEQLRRGLFKQGRAAALPLEATAEGV